ncbi:MAG TPA: thioredoxin domain-containing protein [Flavobacteriales bacterium]|nr:thioredoxin domain-containing protein [Flavobacteriales bacterium]HRE97179.1 thioredoxin domain-containing protein [Flavobacteriales bacterium]HRJ35005.1 thioredoxin domain-containing protein [Flavobacteriales bacterium]HRJ38673.1 thioredoxin domain-containing protein [Flavobacteriales bacterium]
MPNRLSTESSPYLRQHAENPVDWFPWGEEAFSKAKAEGKLVLISIGYSSCHWCHVMEHETFSDVAAAEVMNRYFICIKVDREERPDIDQVYMNAVQLMSGQGGWPLNCFVMPDGRPVYGGTYFPRENWLKVLQHLNAIWKDEPEKVEDYAQRLTEGVQLSDLAIPEEGSNTFSAAYADQVVQRWKNHFDSIEGGPNRAPKFPLPNNYEFLLRYAIYRNDDSVMKHVRLTLDKIALGGIYDQLGGGITRYSTDMIWKVPHFEKMLYDNAQIISLYSEAFRFTRDPLYLEIAERSIRFCIEEWSKPESGFYSALDADSEGEEGKYYVWKKDELQGLLGEEYSWFSEYYNINYLGEWEHGNYILLRRERDDAFARKHKMDIDDFLQKKKKAHHLLMTVRKKRISPLLDDKILCSWNALMITALCDAWKCSGKNEYRDKAISTAHFILREMLKGDGGLYHCFHSGKAYVDGFLEDYAFCIEAFTRLFSITGDELWLAYADKWATYVLHYFSDENDILFYFTSSKSEALIARKTELSDNVIPASNSVMARSLHELGGIMGKIEYTHRANRMLQTVYSHMEAYGAGYSNWGMLLLDLLEEPKEVVVCGEDADTMALRILQDVPPHVRVYVCIAESDLPLFKNRFKTGQSLIYVCRNKSCNLPVQSPEEALEQLT